MDFNTILESARNNTQLKIIVGLVLLDLGLGLLAAIRNHTWSWKVVANFYITNVIPYVGGYLLLRVVVMYIWSGVEVVGLPAPDLLVSVAWLTLLASLVNSVVKNLVDLYPPLKVPIEQAADSLRRFVPGNNQPPPEPPKT